MFNNHFKIAARTLMRNKLHTAINVLGLAIGISACFTIFQIVQHEYSFDTFHPDKERIYRVYTRFTGQFEGTNPGVSAPLAQAVKEQIPSVEIVAPMIRSWRTNAELMDANTLSKTFRDKENICFVEASYFDLFSSYEWLAGNPKSALEQPNQVVLLESTAVLYFGDALSAMGKEIRYADSLMTTVAGIVKDLDKNSDLIFTDFISYSSLKNTWLEEDYLLNVWSNFNSNIQLFIKKREGVENTTLTAAFDRLLAENNPPEENENTSWSPNFELQALSDLHFDQGLGVFNQEASAAHRPTLYALMGIAAILLLIASINFINLATAQSLQRSKEVGVRKVLGGDRSSLIKQFLSETTMITSVAVLLSIGFSKLSFTYFKEFLPFGLTFDLFQPSVLLFLLTTIVVVSLLSGFYPAFVLSSFRPIMALKKQSNNNTSGNNNAWLRKTLIVVQFCFSLILITSTLIIGQQVNYLFDKDLGFEKDAIVYFRIPWSEEASKKQLLKEELQRLPEIAQISLQNAPPAINGMSGSTFELEVQNERQSHHLSRKVFDPNYLDLYSIELVAGRNLQHSDTLREFLINEKLVNFMGLQNPEEAIGKMVTWGEKSYPIVGVTKDFHHVNLKYELEPLIMNMDSYTFSMALKLGTQNMSQAMQQVEQIWASIYPNHSFNYRFYDETIAKFYETEQRTSKLLSTATGVAIFISCIGLFGLVSFSVARRTREIGIRKVLGASIPNIVALLSKDFILLVFIAILIGSPIAWYLAQNWLSDFAYRIDLQWWMFALAGLAAIVLAFLTISFQSVRAALANPVESLRNE